MKFQIVQVTPQNKVTVLSVTDQNDGDNLLRVAKALNSSKCTLLGFTHLPVVVCSDGTRFYLR